MNPGACCDTVFPGVIIPWCVRVRPWQQQTRFWHWAGAFFSPSKFSCKFHCRWLITLLRLVDCWLMNFCVRLLTITRTQFLAVCNRPWCNIWRRSGIGMIFWCMSNHWNGKSRKTDRPVLKRKCRKSASTTSRAWPQFTRIPTAGQRPSSIFPQSWNSYGAKISWKWCVRAA